MSSTSPQDGGAMFALDNPLGVFRAMAFIAWSDERITPEERDAMRGLCEALELDGESRARCLAMLAEKPSIENLRDELSDPVEARFAIAQAVVMAHADGEFSAIEREHVRLIARELAISENELLEIEGEVREMFEGRALGPMRPS